jgi:hypothetical protein
VLNVGILLHLPFHLFFEKLGPDLLNLPSCLFFNFVLVSVFVAGQLCDFLLASNSLNAFLKGLFFVADAQLQAGYAFLSLFQFVCDDLHETVKSILCSELLLFGIHHHSRLLSLDIHFGALALSEVVDCQGETDQVFLHAVEHVMVGGIKQPLLVMTYIDFLELFSTALRVLISASKVS